MDFSIRPARAGDISQMCALLADLFSLESDFSPDRKKQARGLKLLLSDASGSSAVFVAEHDKEIIGMCSVQTLISTAEGGPVGLLEDVIVRKEHRGKGIGKGLLAEVVRWCTRKNLSRLQLLRDADNEPALKFYARSGWAGINLVCMRKML
ncbi:MAG: GNAT family N-acetyltransferase [Nitrospirae bacterium]|nr:GNAT family N-acetyltransferase [Nitrospirota bacterium]